VAPACACDSATRRPSRRARSNGLISCLANPSGTTSNPSSAKAVSPNRCESHRKAVSLACSFPSVRKVRSDSQKSSKGGEAAASREGIARMIASAQVVSVSLGAMYSHAMRVRFSADSLSGGGVAASVAITGSRRRRMFARPCTAPTAAAKASFSVAPSRE